MISPNQRPTLANRTLNVERMMATINGKVTTVESRMALANYEIDKLFKPYSCLRTHTSATTRISASANLKLLKISGESLQQSAVQVGSSFERRFDSVVS